MRWIGDTINEKGVVERRFDVHAHGRTIPGLLWTPDGAAGERPLVLMGHGAALHKRTPYIVYLARVLVRHHGFAAAAIDGPLHGDRAVDDPLPLSERWSDWWTPQVTDETVADWKATLAALQGLDEVGRGPLAYWGLSMGTIFGLPFVASEAQVRVAVLGLMGLTGPTKERIESDAARITIPLLFLLQNDDQLFKRDKGLALFDALGSTDKRLHLHPGLHAAVPPEEFAASEAFLVQHLGS